MRFFVWRTPLSTRDDASLGCALMMENGYGRYRIMPKPGAHFLGLNTATTMVGKFCPLRWQKGNEEFRKRPPRSLLLLVEPEELRLRLVRRREGFQTRARFLLGDERYDLVVTDPIYREHMERFPPEEEYPFTQVVPLAPGARVFLTISLGEEFRGAFYKLVAAIIVFPPQAVRWRGIC